MGEEVKKEEEEAKEEVKEEGKKEEEAKGGEEKKEEAKGEEEKKEEPKGEEPPGPLPPVVLQVDLHCVGCAKKIQRSIFKCKEVEGVEAEMGKNLLTVKGIVDPQALCNRIQKKIMRKATIISPVLPPPPPEGEAQPLVVLSQKKRKEKKEETFYDELMTRKSYKRKLSDVFPSWNDCVSIKFPKVHC